MEFRREFVPLSNFKIRAKRSGKAPSVLLASSDSKTKNVIALGFNIEWPDATLKIVESGRECIHYTQEDNLDIIVLDSSSEGFDGWQVLREIRSFSKVTVVMLLNVWDEPLCVKSLESGADGYMVKPLHQMETIARIRSLLYKRKQLSNG
jgi:DNA-binding response OmpR family regulator